MLDKWMTIKLSKNKTKEINSWLQYKTLAKLKSWEISVKNKSIVSYLSEELLSEHLILYLKWKQLVFAVLNVIMKWKLSYKMPKFKSREHVSNASSMTAFKLSIIIASSQINSLSNFNNYLNMFHKVRLLMQ